MSCPVALGPDGEKAPTVHSPGGPHRPRGPGGTRPCQPGGPSGPAGGGCLTLVFILIASSIDDDAKEKLQPISNLTGEESLIWKRSFIFTCINVFMW